LPPGHRRPRREEAAISTVEDDAEQPVRMLGARIRQLRRARGLTLVRLASLAGLSHPFLSKLERDLASPSMASLAQIARALGISQLELLAGPDAGAVPVQPPTETVRAGEGVCGPYGLGTAQLLVAGTRRMEPMLCEGTNTDPGGYYVHAEDEFLHVLSGAVRVDLAEHGSPTLAAGDSLYLNGGVPHRWCAVDPEGYRLFIVKETPPRS
jgi:transcriptional regulator with XRE-family HTH domain